MNDNVHLILIQLQDINWSLLFTIFLGALCLWLTTKLLLKISEGQEIVRENKKLSDKNAMLEADQLKFQLQPHTLRNMVATLHVSAKNLYKGSEALAETLDYILYPDSKHLTSIENELEFLKNYKSLQGNFVHQIDSIQMDFSEVDKTSRHYTIPCIPHLITAYFIENAFKHGDINHPEFLDIRLKLSNKLFELEVTNRIKNRPDNNKGGVGLTNMRKRLELLHAGKYEIHNTCNEQEYYSSLLIHL